MSEPLPTLRGASPLNASDDNRLIFTNNTSETLNSDFDDTPADFGNMDTLSWQVEYRQQGLNDDTLALGIVIVDSAITVILASGPGETFSTVSTAVTSTTDVTTGPTAFAFVNTTATKTQWDGAVIRLFQDFSQNMAADGCHIEVDEVLITGTYTASGPIPNQGSASGSFTFAGSTTGARQSAGSVSATASWDGSATGTRKSAGSASGTHVWAGSATGSAPSGVSEGSAAGTFTFVGAATGESPAVGAQQGSATGTWTLSGTATGSRASTGSATGSFTWFGSATGSQPGGPSEGSAAGTVTFAGTATGTTSKAGLTLGAVSWSGTSTGSRASEGSASGTHTWAGSIPLPITFGPTPRRSTVFTPRRSL